MAPNWKQYKYPSADEERNKLVYLYTGILLTNKNKWTIAQFSSVTQACPTLCNPMNCSTPGLPVHHQLPESTQTISIKSVMPSSHLILCRPLLLLPTIFPNIIVFSKESVLCIRWQGYLSFSFNIRPSNEHPGLISFRTGWISLQSKGLSTVFSNTTVQKHQFFRAQLSSQSTLTSIHDYWKNHSKTQ